MNPRFRGPTPSASCVAGHPLDDPRSIAGCSRGHRVLAVAQSALGWPGELALYAASAERVPDWDSTWRRRHRAREPDHRLGVGGLTPGGPGRGLRSGRRLGGGRGTCRVGFDLVLLTTESSRRQTWRSAMTAATIVPTSTSLYGLAPEVWGAAGAFGCRNAGLVMCCLRKRSRTRCRALGAPGDRMRNVYGPGSKTVAAGGIARVGAGGRSAGRLAWAHRAGRRGRSISVRAECDRGREARDRRRNGFRGGMRKEVPGEAGDVWLGRVEGCNER